MRVQERRAEAEVDREDQQKRANGGKFHDPHDP